MKNQAWIQLPRLALHLVPLLALLPYPGLANATHITPDTIPGEPLRLIQTDSNHRTWMTGAEIGELAMKSHADGHCGGFMDVTDHPDKQPVFQPAFGLFDSPNAPRHMTEVNALNGRLSADRLIDSVKQLSAFTNRFYKAEQGVRAAEWIRDHFVAMAKGRTDVTVQLFQHAKFIQPSVIVKIAGRGPHASEHVILGAHEDSVNWSNGRPTASDLAPGADDDASGVATLLESFRVLMDSGYQPDRTIEFRTYAGEELGLLGSQDIAEQYKERGIKVVAVLQMDMTLYPSDTPQIHMISDHTERSLTKFTEALVDEYVRVPWVEMECGYACSDHASWTDAGYASSFPFEAAMDQHDPKIHTADDTVDLLNPGFGLHFAKLTTAFAVELGTP